MAGLMYLSWRSVLSIAGLPGPRSKYSYVITFLLGIDLNDFLDGFGSMDIFDQYYDISVIQ